MCIHKALESSYAQLEFESRRADALHRIKKVTRSHSVPVLQRLAQRGFALLAPETTEFSGHPLAHRSHHVVGNKTTLVLG